MFELKYGKQNIQNILLTIILPSLPLVTADCILGFYMHYSSHFFYVIAKEMSFWRQSKEQQYIWLGHPIKPFQMTANSAGLRPLMGQHSVGAMNCSPSLSIIKCLNFFFHSNLAFINCTESLFLKESDEHFIIVPNIFFC